MHFIHPVYIPFLFFLVAIFILLCLVGYNFKKKKRELIASNKMFKIIAPTFSPKQQIIKVIYLIIGFFFLAFSIAGPMWGKQTVDENLKGIEVFIALDCSQSMQAQDYKPSRIDFAKALIIKLIDLLQGNRIGIIAFAGEAFMECPLTSDMEAAKLFIDYADYTAMPVQGSDIEKAIKLASESFSPAKTGSKVMIILSDGEHFSGDAIKAAEEARANGISVYTIGIGSPEGSKLIINGREKKDKYGRTVISKLDEEGMKQIAGSANGVYLHADYEESSIRRFVSSVKSLKKGDFGVRNEDLYIHRFQYTLIISFIFICLSIILTERRFGKK